MIAAANIGRSVALVVVACFSSFVGAAAQRTFVASNGVDNLVCAISAPCRGFTAAVAATLSGGEVIVLDSAGYGPVTINQAISIIAPPGVYAGISVSSGAGITIAAGAADRVVLRGLTINGQGGNDGIRINSGMETHIEDCTAASLQIGIRIAGGGAVHIVRTTLRGNVHNGVLVTPSAAVAVVTTLMDSLVTGNGDEGFLANTQVAGSTIDATLTRTTATRNGASGFVAGSANLGTVNVAIADSIAAENGGFGVFAIGTNTLLSISGSSLVRNVSADFGQFGAAVIRTAGNNAVTGRGAADLQGSLTPNPLK